MDIEIVEKHKKGVNINDLCVGDMFLYNKRLYLIMETDPPRTKVVVLLQGVGGPYLITQFLNYPCYKVTKLTVEVEK